MNLDNGLKCVFLAVKCPEMAVPSGTTRNSSENTYLTYVHYSCTGNTRMLDGSTYRTILCDAAGSWSDAVTDCRGTVILMSSGGASYRQGRA